MKIQNRTFIVSGGSSGLGLATVKELVAAEAFVSVIDLADGPAEMAELSSVRFNRTDITKTDEIQAALEATISWTEQTGAKLGGVINCAGVASRQLFISTDGDPCSEDWWTKILAVNLLGTVNLTRLATKYLVDVPQEGLDGERGVIIMTSSMSAYEGQLGQTAYSASKGAIDGMTLPLARDLAGRGIRVATISPAGMDTPMANKYPREVVESFISRSSLFPARFGRPDEYASTVLWILRCSYVNGETVRLTGGSRLPPTL